MRPLPPCPRRLPAPGDAGACPSYASQPAVEADVISACQGTSLFGNGGMIDETALDVTEVLSEDLKMKVGPTTAGALLGDMEQQCVCEVLLPAFLPPVRERTEINEEMANMQRMKEAAPEHVRWRSPTVVAADPAAVAVVVVMCAFVREWAQGNYVPDLGLVRGTGDPGSDPDNFLAHALKGSLGCSS